MRVPRPVWWALLAILAVGAPFVLRSNNFYMHLANLALVYALAVVGYNICFGDAGQLSLGQAAFFALGAYTSGLLTTTFHLSFWLGLLGGVLVTGVASVIIGIPSLKLQGPYLALATVGFGEIIRLILTNWDAVTHGTEGVRAIPKPAIGGLVFKDEFSFYYLALVFLILFAVAAVRIGRSRFGIAFKAIRDDEIAARSSGIDVTRLKIGAFTIAAIYTSAAGSLYAHLAGFINPDFFNFDLSILFVIMLIVGGIGTIAGCIVGAVVLTYLPELLRFAQLAYMMIYGIGVVLLVVYMPGGIVGALRDVWTRRFMRKQVLRPRVLEASP